MKKVFKFGVYCFLILSTVLTSFAVYLFVSTKNVRFDENKLTKSGLNVDFVDENGVPVSDFNSKTLSFEQEIPAHVKNAFIAVEDKNFYKHSGIDYKRIIGATLKNIKTLSFKEGASTISQQLIKNTHLTNNKTLKRKFAEIKLAKQLEKRFSKDQIITFYLNTIYFGENCYGIKAASERYFGKPVQELDLNEAAMLAGIIKAPSKYNPVENYDLSVKRKNVVLSLMSKNGYITSEKKDELNKKTVKIKQKSNMDSYYYQVKRELEQILKTPYYNGKLTVCVYLDQELQKYISEIKTDVDTDKCYVVADNKSCGIKAFYSTVANASRMPGSTVKPILVYTPCFQEKIISPQTKILDAYTDFNGYKPKNYGDKYYGYISAKEALSKSLNVPAVKLLDSLTVKKCRFYAQKMGINIKNNNLGTALGGIDEGISFTNLTSCYATLANGGEYAKCKFIKKIVNAQGKTIYENTPHKTRVFSPESCYLTTDCLNYAVKEGTSKKLSGKNYQICAKTGTTGCENGNTDAFSLSYTTKNTILVWLGNADNSYMDNKITGSSYPTAIASIIYDKLYSEFVPSDFEKPENVIKVKLDRSIYNETGEMIQTEGNDFIEGIFIRGNEPKIKKTSNIIYVKINKITEYNSVLKIFSEFFNASGYELLSNGKVLFDVTDESFIVTLKSGSYSFTLHPYRIENGKKIYGNAVTIPPFNIAENNEKIPDNWWE